MLAGTAPAVGQEDGGPAAVGGKAGGEPQVPGHAGAVAPDVDGAAFHPIGGGGNRLRPNNESEDQRRQHGALQDPAR